MKILYVIEGISTRGGLERIIIDKMNAIAMTPDMSVSLMTIWKDKETPSFPLSPRVERHSLDVDLPHSGFSYLLTLARVLRRYNKTMCELNPDVVVHFRAMGAFLIGYAKHHCRTIFESHLSRSTNNHLWLYPRMESKVDTVVCLTKGDATEYRIAKNVHVIPNFSAIEPLSEPDYANKHCAFVGRLCPEKNPLRLITLWERIQRQHADWTLDIYGDGEMLDICRQAANNSQSRINFHGHCDNVAEALSQSSILLLTSRTEGFGLCILEAMKCGIPVVSLNTKYGPSDIIEHGITGFCTPYKDDEAFVDATCQLLNSEELRRQYGKAAKERAKRFDKNTIIAEWIKLFKRQ